MYSTEQRKLAIEAYIKFDLSAADTVAKLGYPTRQSLRAWYKDYLEHGEVRPPKRQREPKFTLGMRRAAVDHHLAHGGEPRRDHAQDGLSRRQGVSLRLDRRARPRAEEIQGAEPEGGPCPA